MSKFRTNEGYVIDVWVPVAFKLAVSAPVHAFTEITPSLPKPCCAVRYYNSTAHPRYPGLLTHQEEGCDGAEMTIKYTLKKAGVVRKSCPFTHGAIRWISI